MTNYEKIISLTPKEMIIRRIQFKYVFRKIFT